MDKGRRRWTAEGQLRDSTRSIPIFFQHNENERYRTPSAGVHSDQMGWTRREPDSGLGHTQDYRTRYTDDDRTFTQRTEQPAGRKRRAGGRPAGNHIPEETGYTETIGGISHGSVPCLRPTDRIVRRLVVTFRRATQIGLQTTTR